MRIVQQGDYIQIHYVKRFPDGSVVSSRSRGDPPLGLTVGTDHRRLPGLGSGLLGSAPGDRVTLTVPAERAYGLPDPSRIRRLARERFSGHQTLTVGKWIRILDHRGRRRLVRIVEVRERVVVVDTNHPRAGQAMDLEVEVISIQGPGTGADGQSRGAGQAAGPLPGAAE